MKRYVPASDPLAKSVQAMQTYWIKDRNRAFDISRKISEALIKRQASKQQ